MIHFLILKQADLDGKVPDAIQIVPLGDMTIKGKQVRITPELVQSIIANFRNRKNDLVVDYEHQTLTGVKAPAAGWIKELIDKGAEGLWARVEWTLTARDHLANKEYRYLSPVLLARRKDGSVFLPEVLHSAALTNDPAIDGMVPIAAKEFINQFEEKEYGMELLKKLIAKLGLKEDASEDEVLNAVIACKAKADNPPAKEVTKEILPKVVAKALDLKDDADASEAEATILAMKQKAGSVESAELKKVQDELAAMRAEKLVAKAMEDGKVTADQKEWATEYAGRDPKGFEVFAAKAPRVVPVGKIAGAPDEDPAKGKVTNEILLVAKQFGNSPEDLVKFGGLETAN